ncbi:hemerythrin domain-containing protein [Geothrix sp. 21YS21S-4]|uniref:hemerythrin domain-containing protein n=1 Tax=Geothrix sp. 21YS21S-4 TaxID=3068889 RepID=UPI0027B9AEC6|nr:hemerythrin domain-containing protein [Geothrix sp. 21YS21S-4]
MTTPKKSESPTGTATMDAISLLKSDHQKVLALFDSFEEIKDDGPVEERRAIVEQICSELTVHTAIEEKVFYPAAREAIDDDDIMDEAKVEHAGAKALIRQLQGMEPDDDLYNAKVKVLSEYIRHHVKEEQGEMFPKVKKTDLDLDALGERMKEMKDRLTEEEPSSRGAAMPKTKK